MQINGLKHVTGSESWSKLDNRGQAGHAAVGPQMVPALIALRQARREYWSAKALEENFATLDASEEQSDHRRVLLPYARRVLELFVLRY